MKLNKYWITLFAITTIAITIFFFYKKIYTEPFEQFKFNSEELNYIHENIINPVDSFYFDRERDLNDLFFDTLYSQIFDSEILLNFEIEVKDPYGNIVYHKLNEKVRLLDSTIDIHDKISIAQFSKKFIRRVSSCKVYHDFSFKNAQIFEWTSIFNKKRGKPFTFYFRGVLINNDAV